MNKKKLKMKCMEIPTGTCPNLLIHDITLMEGESDKLVDFWEAKVGGELELICLTDRAGLYINKKGHQEELALNKVATCLTERYVQDFVAGEKYIVGTAMLIGLAEGPELIAAPVEVMYDALRVCRMIRETIDAGKISGIGSEKWQEAMATLINAIAEKGESSSDLEGSFEWN